MFKMKNREDDGQEGHHGDTKKRKVSPDSVHRRCPASEALRGIERINEKQVRVILAEGWENVLPHKGEDDPGCLIMWDHDNISATVAAFNAAMAAGAAPPAWLNVGVGPNPFTVPGLKASILAHVCVTGGGGGVVGNALIAPNDFAQYGQVKTIFNNIGFEPFFIQHAECPIGRHFALADRRANTTAIADPVAAPPVGLGVAVFA